VSVVQHQWSLLHHEIEAEAAAIWTTAHGARFLAWSPLASGFLTDGFALGSLEPDDLRHRLPMAGVPLDDLRAAASDRGMSLQQFALSWVARRGHPIVGARSPEEVALMAQIEPLARSDFGRNLPDGAG